MKLVLFSSPDKGIIKKLEKEILPTQGLVFGYMPADGNNPKPKYTPFWKEFAKRNKAKFIYINNSKKPTKNEMEGIYKIDSLFIAGGNAFDLLDNTRKAGYDKIIKNSLAQKKNFIYAGFSAGAVLATPDIRVAAKDNNWGFGHDENNAGLKNTKSLGLIDFEILPHYQPSIDNNNIKKFEDRYQTKLKPLTNQDYLIIKK
jgi:peptidase E